jgi:hypothetical protein
VSLLNASTRNTPKCTRSLFELFRGYHRHSCESNRDASRKPKRDEQTNVLVAHAASSFSRRACRLAAIAASSRSAAKISRTSLLIAPALICGID